MAIISLAQARTQLRISDSQTEFDDDLNLKREQASALVMDYLEDYLIDYGSPAPDWDQDSGSPAPSAADDPTLALVQAATLEVLTNLFHHRGDSNAEGPMTARVVQILRGLKVPPIG